MIIKTKSRKIIINEKLILTIVIKNKKIFK